MIDNKIMVQKKFYCPFDVHNFRYVVFLKLKPYNEEQKLEIAKKFAELYLPKNNNEFDFIYNLKEFEGYAFFFVSSEIKDNKKREFWGIFMRNLLLNTPHIDKTAIATDKFSVYNLSTEETKYTLLFILMNFFEDLKIDRNMVHSFDIEPHFFEARKNNSLKDVSAKFFVLNNHSI